MRLGSRIKHWCVSIMYHSFDGHPELSWAWLQKGLGEQSSDWPTATVVTDGLEVTCLGLHIGVFATFLQLGDIFLLWGVP